VFKYEMFLFLGGFVKSVSAKQKTV